MRVDLKSLALAETTLSGIVVMGWGFECCLGSRLQSEVVVNMCVSMHA